MSEYLDGIFIVNRANTEEEKAIRARIAEEYGLRYAQIGEDGVFVARIYYKSLEWTKIEAIVKYLLINANSIEDLTELFAYAKQLFIPPDKEKRDLYTQFEVDLKVCMALRKYFINKDILMIEVPITGQEDEHLIREKTAVYFEAEYLEMTDKIAIFCTCAQAEVAESTRRLSGIHATLLQVTCIDDLTPELVEKVKEGIRQIDNCSTPDK